MQRAFILSCESTVDLPYSYVSGRDIPVLFYSYVVEGKEYAEDMGRNSQALSHFYQLLEDGKIPSTSQLNIQTYIDFFDELPQRGDVLHIAFGSGMTSSVTNAMQAAEIVREKHPDRRLTVISMEETEQWVLAYRGRVHHQFFSTDLKYYRRSGRMSGAAATVGAILNICPIMRLNDAGRILAYDKVRGKKNAIQRTVETMAAHAEDGTAYHGKCFICHSNCIADAELTKQAVQEKFPNIHGAIRICDIGTIIASHCGPGTVAVFFLGDEREP